MRRLLAAGLAAACAAATGAWAWLAPAPVTSRSPTPVRVTITIHYSRFSIPSLSVHRGQAVTFVVRNTDPIDHEFLVGDQRMQDIHEAGADIVHDGSVPGQISVPAESEVRTIVTFDAPTIGTGGLQFACHLAGHYAYGMHGAIVLRG